jgi:hypothetical protein
METEIEIEKGGMEALSQLSVSAEGVERTEEILCGLLTF